MNVFKAFLKRKETLVGIGAALAFQLIFFTVWLTAYDGILNRTEQLKVAVINEDKEIGESISATIINSRTITAKPVEQLAEAKNELESRKVNMVIRIPNGLSDDISKGKTAKLEYYVNQAAPMLTRQIMEGTAKKITEAASEEIRKQTSQTAKTTIVAKAESLKPEFGKVAENSIASFDSATSFEPLGMQVKKINNTDGFAASVIPLLIVLASFVGAMVLSMQLHFASASLVTQFGKWPVFGARLSINIIVSITLSILTMLLMASFDIEFHKGAVTVWAFQSLLFFSFLSFAQTALILFGNAGMVVNILAMATQIASSGAMVPKELLSSFYSKVGDLLPATYGASGYFSTIFGGNTIQQDIIALMLITGTVLALSAIVLTFKKQTAEKTGSKAISA